MHFVQTKASYQNSSSNEAEHPDYC